MEQLIDLITFSEKEKEGHKFYKTKFFCGESFPQYEGTPQKDNPTPDDKYIDGMDSNAWWNLKLCASQYWGHRYSIQNWLPNDLKGGKNSNAWKWFLREEKHISVQDRMVTNPYTVMELNAQRTALHNYISNLLPNVYDAYCNS